MTQPTSHRALWPLQRAVMQVAAALRFFSRVPVPRLPLDTDAHAPFDFARGAAVLPIAGALIGFLPALALALGLAVGLSAPVAGAIAIAVSLAATGALHEDGLADVADGFGGGGTRARKLEIMRDSRLGTYGVAALVLSLLLRTACIATMAARDAQSACAALIVIGGLSRTLALVPLALLGPARTEGAGHAAARPAADALALAALLCCGLCVVAGVFGVPLVRLGGATALALALILLLTALAKRQIGGQTGDVLGAAQQTAEIAALLVLSAT